MKPGLQTLWIVLAIILAPAPALALTFPEPLSHGELLQKSDLAALVRVLAVTCVATVKDEAGEDVPTRFSARLRLLEVKKGNEKQGNVITLFWSNVPGDRTGAYYPGEEVWTHLTKEDGGYRDTWWNAKGPTVKDPVTTVLPATLGQTVTAADSN